MLGKCVCSVYGGSTQVDECQAVRPSSFDAIIAGSIPAYSCKSPNVDNKRPYMSKLVIS
ncbi:hypothetical protein M434DRAFT_310247 [Hypoxylon sp. CO27-5]|nr:hypothetical protein M434DRAFT_310247 [Hypoxylon sp. CO27-5]